MPGCFGPHACRHMYTLPSLKLLFALVFGPLGKLTACTDFLHLQAVVLPIVHLAQGLSYKGSS